jgi:prepilin-type N-terminal cleavage/methylation domain-containing protein
MMRARGGLTLVEMLIALAIMGVLFAGLAYMQVTSMRGSATSRAAADAKGEANRVLERVVEDVVFVDTSTDPDTFNFESYYDACGPNGTGGDECDGSTAAGDLEGFERDPNVETTWSIEPVPGTSIEQEGVLSIAVTSRHDRGANITLGSAISCYDVFPSPTATTPEPCPTPTTP